MSAIFSPFYFLFFPFSIEVSKNDVWKITKEKTIIHQSVHWQIIRQSKIKNKKIRISQKDSAKKSQSISIVNLQKKSCQINTERAKCFSIAKKFLWNYGLDSCRQQCLDAKDYNLFLWFGTSRQARLFYVLLLFMIA